MTSRVIFFYSLIYFLFSCSTKPFKGSRKTNVNNIFFIEAQCTFEDTEDKGAVTGTLLCGNIALKYYYGKDIYSGPLTQEEEFRNAFRGNYHIKFFEKIHIDAKLNRMFIDSVQIKSIQPIGPSNSNLLFPCSSCNKVASLVFRNRNYFYPVYSNNNDQNNYQIKEDTIDGFHRKIFFDKTDSLSSGLYLRPISKSKNTKNLRILCFKNANKDLLTRLLESVRFTKN
jgi:hypothetical protein